MLVWDLQTGVVTDGVNPRDFGELAFSGNGGHVTILKGSGGGHGEFLTCNTLDGTRLCHGWSYELGAHWIHEDTLRIATSFETNGVYVVEIGELPSTSTPSLHLLASFPAPPHKNGFSFSPVSYHASFVTGMEVVVLDVRNSKTLLRTDVARADLSPGRFSPDGRFFACGMSGREIRVWQNTPTGYLPWSNLRPRLPFEGFVFSPTTPSILTWGPEGIQLLYPDDRISPPSSDSGGPNHEGRDHLVAYSVDHAYVATARQEGGFITVLDSLLGTLLRSANTSMKIRMIEVVDDKIFVANENTLTWWDPQTGGRVHGAHGAQSEVVIGGRAQHLAFSHDCSYIAFSFNTSVFLYDVTAQKITAEHKSDNSILDIRFSPDMHSLRLFTLRSVSTPSDMLSQNPRKLSYSLVELEMADGAGFGNVTRELLEDAWSWVDLFSRGSRIWSGSEQWVVDPRGGKLLWLPPSWRVKRPNEVRWDGDFLALLDGRHELPIIVEFYP